MIATGAVVAVLLTGFWASGAFTPSGKTRPMPSPPGQPTGLTETSASTSSAAVAWTAPSGPVSSYTVLVLSPWVRGCEGTYSDYARNITSTSATLTGWSSGTVECVEVEALNGSQAGLPSAPIAVATITAAPSGLESSGVTTGSVTLNWTAPATSPASGVVTSYQVIYTAGEGQGSCGIWGSPIYTGPSLSYTVTGLTEDTPFCFEVAAVDAGGTSADSTVLSDILTLGPEGQATNALNVATVLSTQTFSVISGQLMLATVTSYGTSAATPSLSTQNDQTFELITSNQNTYDSSLWTYVFEVVANISTSSEVVTLTDSVTSQYMLGIVSYTGYSGVTTVGSWVTATGYTDTGNVSTVSGATLVACIGYVTDISTRSFSPGYVEATWTAATTNCRADQWYYLDGATSGTNSGTVTRGLAGATSIVLLALT